MIALLAGCLTLAVAPEGKVVSGDASVRWTPSMIRMETKSVGLVLTMPDQNLLRQRWLDKRSKRDLLGSTPMEEFALQVNGRTWSSAERGWKIDPPAVERQKDRSLLVCLRAVREGVSVQRYYRLYPGLTIIREWMEISGEREFLLENPLIGRMRIEGQSVNLHWMTGAEPWMVSWQLRTEPPSRETRIFDSYDAPPTTPTSNDGVDFRILLNDRQVFPETGWGHSASSSDPQTHRQTLTVKAGDRLLFLLSRHGNMTCDTTEWDPVITYADGPTFRASEGFSDRQGQSGWGYGYLSDSGAFSEMVYDPSPGRYGKRWRRKIGVIEPFIAEKEMHPDPEGSAVRVFTVPRDGQITLEGVVVNTGNAAAPGKGFRMGSQTYAPWFCLQEPNQGQGVFLGFDCIAHWRAEVSREERGGFAAVHLAGFRKEVQAGEVVRTPTLFTGLLYGDLDEMGQELHEWQYRYMWDYTRAPWFAAVRLLGYWYKGTKWPTPFAAAYNDPEAAYRKAFRTTELMRQVGGDTYHRDWGWWDKAGDWNGPDFRAVNEFLRRHGMNLLMYAHIYNVEGDSSVAKQNPGWLISGGVLDQSLPEVVDYEASLLSQFYQRWGAYQFRNDGTVIAPRDNDDTSLLAQQQGFFEVIRRFLDRHPDCSMHGVNGGGFAINWEYLRLTSGFQFTDGQSAETASYYISYLFPPDKINNMPDIWDPERFDPATWRGLLCCNIDFTGDTFDPVKLEGIRQILDIYRYLKSRGVAGRWSRIYHPRVEGENETVCLQRLSRDRTRGAVITRRRIQGQVTIFPKGLLPETIYRVEFQDTPGSREATGKTLMREGITLQNPPPGEIIYLNLPDHPGNSSDRKPPSRPANVAWREARWMGVPGVEVSWRASRDDCWISCYEVYRDEVLLDRVAKGQFYFDHSAGADTAAYYQVCAVDGAGNRSERSRTARKKQSPRQILDDTDAVAIQFSGVWNRETFLPAYRGTLTWSEKAGNSFTINFTGKQITLHSRLGAQGGLARITIDNEAPVVVSCYAADEIPGWSLFERSWEQSGSHTLRVEVLGEADPRGQAARFWLDGISIQP